MNRLARSAVIAAAGAGALLAAQAPAFASGFPFPFPGPPGPPPPPSGCTASATFTASITGPHTIQLASGVICPGERVTVDLPQSSVYTIATVTVSATTGITTATLSGPFLPLNTHKALESWSQAIA